jgi:hypothetical protein
VLKLNCNMQAKKRKNKAMIQHINMI